SELPTLMKNDIRLSVIGDLGRFPPRTRAAVQGAMDATHRNRHMTLTLALDYGGREELVKTVKRLVEDVTAGRLSASTITEETLSARLDTGDMPDPDLVIRTSGEKRVSNFLLWQLAYAELFFTDVRWPDFDRAELARALREFTLRDRRFGATTSPVSARADIEEDALSIKRPPLAVAYAAATELVTRAKG
ncbi:MAG: di-trans,poly-cis-decaprenylcistransferase, partial [Clostridia bacterium]|nr:di-trans,poly-cis-decaprenylcistransferase [Deltaproteobacteria bacterium]